MTSEQNFFFYKIRKLLIESNVYAKFLIHTTYREKLTFGVWGGGGGESRRV